MQTERVHWIDITRGVGIIFVIYAHMLGAQDFRYLFYSFHIPLFFFLSGSVFKNYGNLKIFLKKSVKGLLIPYFIFALVSFVLWLTRQNFSITSFFEMTKQFLSIFYGNSNDGLMAFNNILWFLPALFVTRILFAIFFRYFNNLKSLILVLFSFSLFGYLFSVFFPAIKLPFGAETAFNAVVFYGAGFLWNKSENSKTLLSKHKLLLFPSLLIIGAVISTIEFNAYGHQIDMRLGHLNNYFSFYAEAFSGIFAWTAFSFILGKNALLEKIGKNSLILFAWHLVIFDYLSILINMFVSSNAVKSLKLFIPLIYTITAISVIMSANSFYKKIKLKYARLAENFGVRN